MKTLKLVIVPENKKSHINREIYGHFTEHLGRCIYNGIYVGESSEIPNTNGMRNDVVKALRDIDIPVLRWPGGCFADEYHWEDGIGEKQSRKKMINTHWGGLVEDNSFGTHEFMELCDQLGCEPYVAGNLGSGSVRELSEWVEYMTFDGVSPLAELRKKNGHEKAWHLKYLGIGNENWGCGGNMRPEYYADEYRRYQTYCRDYGDNKLFKIACGPSADDYDWTEKLLSIVKDYHTKGITLHSYTIPTGDWGKKGAATEFSDEEYYSTLKNTWKMDELIRRHAAIMDKYDPNRNIGLIVDEWGCWYDVEKGTNPGFLYQQNTMRDAIVAAINLNIFNEHSSRVIMANLAQCVNVLQSVILTEGDKMALTPTYYVFKLFKGHQDAELLESYLDDDKIGLGGNEIPTVTKSVSLNKNGDMLLTVANCSLSDFVELDVSTGSFVPSSASGEILTGNAHDFNDVDFAEVVKPAEFDGITLDGSKVSFRLPPCSVASIKLKK